MIHDREQGIFHVISPGAALSAAGGSKRLSLASALVKAQEEYPSLKEALLQKFEMEVIFIRAEDSCRATQNTYQNMVAYRKDIGLRETGFTIMSLESQVFFNRIIKLIGEGIFLVFCVVCFVFWWV